MPMTRTPILRHPLRFKLTSRRTWETFRLRDGTDVRYLRCTYANQENFMFQKLATVAIISSALILAACNTVRGAGRDISSTANCTENVINNVRC